MDADSIVDRGLVAPEQISSALTAPPFRYADGAVQTFDGSPTRRRLRRGSWPREKGRRVPLPHSGVVPHPARIHLGQHVNDKYAQSHRTHAQRAQ